MLLYDGYNHRTGTISAVCLANGGKPFACTKKGRNGGEISVVNEFREGDASWKTKGNFLPRTYQPIIGLQRGLWSFTLHQEGTEGWWAMDMKFVSTLQKDEYGKFPIVNFSNIYIRKGVDGVELMLPEYANDDYNCMLEESLSNEKGILVPVIQALAKATVNPVALKGNPVYSRPVAYDFPLTQEGWSMDA